MDLLSKIVILFIILIASYLLYRLIMKNQKYMIGIQQKKQIDVIEKEGFQENLDASSQSSFPSMTSTVNVELPINQYFIKSSFNSAYGTNENGAKNTVSLFALKNVMDRGCRFLDFEVYLAAATDIANSPSIPQVGFSTKSSYDVVESANILSLDSVFQQIAETYSSVSNGQDPLFIQLRIKSKMKTILPEIGKLILSNFKQSLYNGIIEPAKIKLSELQRKIVILVDVNYLGSDYKLQAACDASTPDCIFLPDVINAEVGTSDIPSTSNVTLLDQPKTPPKIKSDNGAYTTVSKWMLSMPEIGMLMARTNPDFVAFVRDYGVQILPLRFYYNDDNLKYYEQMFTDTGKSAFVSISTVIKYIKQNT